MEDELEDYDNPVFLEARTAEMQAAIDQANSNSSLSQLYRQELETYLDDMNEKLDSEGNTLITVPKNFDTIVNAMTREDLLGPDNNNDNTTTTRDMKGNSKRPLSSYGGMKSNWYKYLMQESIDQAMNQEYDGRYSNVFNGNNEKKAAQEEEKIKKGLAEIFYLDRELWKLNKQIKYINEIGNDSRPASMGMDGEEYDEEGNEMDQLQLQDDTLYEEVEGSEMIQPAHSIPNTPKDGTFVTKRYDSESKSALNSARSTPRSKKASYLTHPSGKVTPSSYPHSSKPPISARSERSVPLSSRRGSALPAEPTGTDLVEGEDEEEEHSPGKSGKSGEVKAAMRKLTEEELAKVEEILSRPDDFESDPEVILGHYYDTALQAQHQEINTSLAQYDHLQRLQIEKTEEELKALMIAQKKKDYLAQQLIERKEKQYEMKINKLLQTSTKQTVDLEAFLLSDLGSIPPQSPSQYSQVSATTTGRSQYTKNLAELPESIEEIHPDVPITRTDIAQLIENLKSQYTGSLSSSAVSSRGSALIAPAITTTTADNNENSVPRVQMSTESVSWMSEDIPSTPTTQATAIFAENTNGPSSSSSTSNHTNHTTTSRIAPKEAIQDLLSKYQVEIIQLQSMRERLLLETPSTASYRPSSSSMKMVTTNSALDDHRAAILNAIEDDALGLLDVDALPYYHRVEPSLDTDLTTEGFPIEKEKIAITMTQTSNKPTVTNTFDASTSSKKKSKAKQQQSTTVTASSRQQQVPSSSSSGATTTFMEMIDKPFSNDDLVYLSNVLGMDSSTNNTSYNTGSYKGQQSGNNRGKAIMSLPPNITYEEEEDIIQQCTSPEGIKLPRIPSASMSMGDGTNTGTSSRGGSSQSQSSEGNYAASRILINRRIKQPQQASSTSYKSPRGQTQSQGQIQGQQQQRGSGSGKQPSSVVASQQLQHHAFSLQGNDDWEEVPVYGAGIENGMEQQEQESLFHWSDEGPLDVTASGTIRSSNHPRTVQRQAQPEDLIENVRKFVSC